MHENRSMLTIAEVKIFVLWFDTALSQGES